MSIQAQLNKEALKMLQKTMAYVLSTTNSTALNAIVLRKILNSRTPISNMNETELNKFDKEVLEFLKLLINQ